MAALLLLTCSLAPGIARAADPTDSILTYGCDPPLPRTATNCATWHTSPVSLRWTLIDPNFTPVPGSSCDTTFVDKDTKGTGVTCAVQDVGLTRVQKTVTLRVDQTPPTVTAPTPARPADRSGWWNHAVTWTFSGSDATSGLAGCDVVTYSGPDAAAGDVKGDCRDVAGNAATRHAAIKYDAAAPIVTGATDRPADHGGWWNHPVTVVFSGADPTSGLDGCDTVAYSGPDDPAADVTGGCRDVAGNSATQHVAVKYDANPPTLSALPADVGSNEAVLHWVASPDAVLSEVTRSPGIGDAPASTVYSGTAQTFSDPSVKNDVTYTYSIRASDAAANRASATVVVTPTAEPVPQPDAAPTVVLAPEAAPTPAAVPRGSGGTKPPPRLHWRRVKGADYYNVQLYRGSRKVLSVWPASTHLQLGMRWRFHGRLMRLSAAHYDWYAWPGFGRRSQRRYGRLIVHGKFTFSAAEAARAARRLGL